MIEATADAPKRLIAVESVRYPDAARVVLKPDVARLQVSDDASGEAIFGDAGQVVALRVLPAFAPKAPAVWFVEIRENAAAPPAVNLMAFAGPHVPAGTLLDEFGAAELPTVPDDQLGAVRWYPGSGEVDQVYVQPAWRRRNIATVLIVAAKTLTGARQWPRLWGDGQRTAQGELLRNASSWRVRTQDLTHLAPPMTPGEA